MSSFSRYHGACTWTSPSQAPDGRKKDCITQLVFCFYSSAFFPALSSILGGSHNFFKSIINNFCGCGTTGINVKVDVSSNRYVKSCNEVFHGFGHSCEVIIHLRDLFRCTTSDHSTYLDLLPTSHIQPYFAMHLLKSYTLYGKQHYR